MSGTRIAIFAQISMAALNFGMWQNSLAAGVFLFCGLTAIGEIASFAAKTIKG